MATTFDFTGSTTSVSSTQSVSTTTLTSSTSTLTGSISFVDQGVAFTFSFLTHNAKEAAVWLNDSSDFISGYFSVPTSLSGSQTFVLNPTPTSTTTGVSFLSNPSLVFSRVSGFITVRFGSNTSTSVTETVSTVTSGSGPLTISATGIFPTITFTFSGAGAGVGFFGLDAIVADMVCFLEGTRIATPTGEKPVEELDAGDLVTTADGGSATVRWVGVQEICPTFATPQRDYPIRIRANALGDGVPSRDLYVTGEHALLVDDLLINAGALVNGRSITRVSNMGSSNFRYYHIETDAHDLVLAENTPVETFIDYVTRQRFRNHGEYEALYGDEAHIQEMDIARISTARMVPAEIRIRLAERADIYHDDEFRAA